MYLYMINNYITIAIIVCVILGILIFIDVKDIDLNSPKPPSKLVEEVTYETFNSINNIIH